MDRHLIIDQSLCVGCSACSSVCIRGNIRMEVGHPVETGEGMGCFDCGHCLAVCPKGAISLVRYPGFVPRGYEQKTSPVSAEAMSDLIERRRSIRWFTDEKVTEEEFSAILSAASYAPSVQNSQDTEFVVIDRQMRPFMRHIAEIMAPRAQELPRIAQLIEYLDDPFPTGNNPLIWEGRQMILAFSEEPEDAVISMGRAEIMAYAMGLGGFYSHWIQMAEGQDHGKLMEFFPGISPDKHLGCAFVIGRPRIRFRRTVPRDAPKVQMM